MATLADSFLQDLEDLEDRPRKNQVVPQLPQEEETCRSKMLADNDFISFINDVRQRKDDTSLEAGQQLTEEHEEYQLIVRCNSMARELDDEMFHLYRSVHKFYVTRFPELDSIVVNPLDYLQVVQRVGNLSDISDVDFSDFLPNQVIMAMTVIFTTSSGVLMDEETVDKVMNGCNEAFQLNDCKRDVLLYLESRMSGLAPNISALLGASLAAKLVTAAGGLLNLARMPAQNIMLIGSQKKDLMGMAASTQASMGLIMQSDMVVGTPLEFRHRAIKLVAGKCGLAARVDSFRESPLGQVGTQLREKILQSLMKAQEPPPAKQKKPLPVPQEKLTNHKRGGKRWRAQKEKYGVSEFTKMMNRIRFGEKEDDMDQSNMGVGFGMLGQQAGGAGRIRVAKHKRMEQQLASIKRQRMAASSSGMSSSLAFTPVQGIELPNPDSSRVKKAADAGEKYFAQQAAFVKVQTK